MMQLVTRTRSSTYSAEMEQHGILQDGKGNFSAMRAAFVWLILNGTLMGWFALLTIGTGEAVAVFSAITGVAITLKTIQNQQEKGTVNNGGGESD